ncbi:MAG: alpha/beta hydrolase [Xanthomonadales bacterium]|nr:alpha/beta hydrolase [Xanthomonadales bacterium]
MPGRATRLIHTTRCPDAMIASDGVRLAVYRDGNRRGPTLVFVHGYPDTAQVWERLIAELGGAYDCVRYDVRGAGHSETPTHTSAYRLSCLERDLAAVIDWACPDGERVHLIGHDWGSIQSWEAATDPAMRDRLASLTSISGPCLDHVGQNLRAQWRDNRRALARQARRSWYIALFQIPGLAEFGWSRLMAPRWPATLARLEGQALPVAATWAEDGRAGIRLYRANMGPRLAYPRQRFAVVPVHLIVARHDPFVGPGLARRALDWADPVTVTELDGRHWVIATDAPAVAERINEHIAALEASAIPRRRTPHETAS